jgi:hypothetical protein
VLAGVAGLAAASAEPTPPCRIEVDLDPPRAFVGQQVLYRASVWMRDEVEAFEWSRPLASPPVRSEGLPGDPRGERERAGGVSYRRHDERRALFPERSGSLRLAAPQGLCRSAVGTTAVAVPEVRLTVVDWPPGAPEGFGGLVGPVGLHRTVTPREVHLGESVRVALMLRGAGALWALPSPHRDELAGAELFPQRPELVLERGRALQLRRHFVYDLVPRQPGPLTLPALEIPWLDPATGRYTASRSPAVTLRVLPRAAPASSPARATPETVADRGAGGPGLSPGVAAGLLAALGAALAGAGGVLLRRRRLRSGEVREALRQARAAPGAREAGPALERALRAALRRHVPDVGALTPAELVARDGLPPPVREAAQQLAAVERARFDPRSPPPDVDAVARAIAAL